MATPKTTLWQIEPHTLAKHEILRRYLQAWYGILGQRHQRVIYIDGFCGPGRYTGGEKGSPLIALETAIEHVAAPDCITFLFTDEHRDRVEHLSSELDLITVPATFDVNVTHSTFAEALQVLLDAMDRPGGGELAPTFAFIDPFGWDGLPYTLVDRLLKKTRSEVFVNFMADSVNRFLDHPSDAIRNQILQLFGTDECFEASAAEDRVSALRELYRRQLSKTARYVREFEIRDKKDRRQYYLFFATNHHLGHVKMKEAMWKVDQTGTFSFSDHTYSHPVLFEDPNQADVVWLLIHERFRSKSVWSSDVRTFIENETPFLRPHMIKALDTHHSKFHVAPEKRDRTKYTRGYPDDARIVFF